LKADETHAFISNHLATAAAALLRWSLIAGDARAADRAGLLVGRIVGRQSSEGWFDEYGGADPGYQSLATYYLADMHARRPEWALGEPLARSVRFLWHFAHPDGSFGGVYGSRCTRLYCPAGIEALADDLPEAAALALRMGDSITAKRVVTLSSLDEPNLMPMFNAYCRAAQAWRARSPAVLAPALRGESSRLHFPAAGLWVDAGPRHYTIVSTHKGGTVAHFVDGRLARVDGGVVVRDARGRLGSTQALAPDNIVRLEGDELVVEARVTPMPKRLPTPLQFIVLRLACLTVFRVRPWREWAKRQLVRWLIVRRKPWPVTNRRRVRLGADLSIDDTTTLGRGFALIERPWPFVAIHMASQGYWQLQDEDAVP
jgi:hypothetical protein